jgi:beta-lactamase superfamily II metal-dependent hydrolase
MHYEIDFLPVGDSNGDAICLRYGGANGFWVHVVDGGFTDTAATVINHLRTHYGANIFINHMVLSHADNDHACGLVGVLKAIEVKNLWMNRPWLYAREIIQNFHGNWTLQGLIDHIREKHSYLVELEDIANRRGIPIRSVFQGDKIGQHFTVLAPSRDRYVRLLPDLDKTPQSYAEKKGIIPSILEGAKTVIDAVRESWGIETLDNDPPATSPSNETSVVQWGVFEDKRVLLTADVGPAGLSEAFIYAVNSGRYQRPDFVQIPHHGSRRNVTPTVLNAWLGEPLAVEGEVGVAYCSVGKDADIYPRKKVKNAFIRRGYPVHATRGTTKCHRNGWPTRQGWTNSQPEPIAYSVED